MSNTIQIEKDINEYNKQIKLMRALKDIQLLPSWKVVIEQGYIEGLSKKLVSELCTNSEEEKAITLNTLTGISALQQYFDKIETEGLSAENSKRDAEESLTTLRGTT